MIGEHQNRHIQWKIYSKNIIKKSNKKDENFYILKKWKMNKKESYEEEKSFLCLFYFHFPLFFILLEYDSCSFNYIKLQIQPPPNSRDNFFPLIF